MVGTLQVLARLPAAKAEAVAPA